MEKKVTSDDMNINKSDNLVTSSQDLINPNVTSGPLEKTRN